MNRKECNEFYNYYNNNPRNRITCDCVIRAIALAEKRDYKEVFKEIAQLSLETGYMINSKECEQRYLEKCGWIKCKEPRKFDNTKMSVREFIKSNLYHGETLIVGAGSHHLSVIKEGKIWDIWDASKTTMHTYYIKRRFTL